MLLNVKGITSETTNCHKAVRLWIIQQTGLCSAPQRRRLFMGLISCMLEVSSTESPRVRTGITSLYLSWKVGNYFHLFVPFQTEVFYNYKPDRADKWIWGGGRPSGRKEGIVLAAVKMKNIKRHSTDDSNLAEPLQGYLTSHIKQGNGFFGKQNNDNIFLAATLERNCLLHFRNDRIWVIKDWISVFVVIFNTLKEQETMRSSWRWIQERLKWKVKRSPCHLSYDVLSGQKLHIHGNRDSYFDLQLKQTTVKIRHIVLLVTSFHSLLCSHFGWSFVPKNTWFTSLFVLFSSHP